MGYSMVFCVDSNVIFIHPIVIIIFQLICEHWHRKRLWTFRFCFIKNRIILHLFPKCYCNVRIVSQWCSSNVRIIFSHCDYLDILVSIFYFPDILHFQFLGKFESVWVSSFKFKQMRWSPRNYQLFHIDVKFDFAFNQEIWSNNLLSLVDRTLCTDCIKSSEDRLSNMSKIFE